MKCRTSRSGEFSFELCVADGIEDGLPGDFIIVVRDPGETEMAVLHAQAQGDDLTTVSAIRVFNEFARRGVGTKLYELAAQEACRQGRSLASDATRSPFSEAFWRKQVRRGRAQCLTKGMGASVIVESRARQSELPVPKRAPHGGLRWPCQRWRLKPEICRPGAPAVSLSGLRRR